MATAGDRRGGGPERAFAEVLPAEGPVRLDPDESRHLVRVRRVREGEVVVLFDGRGGSVRGRLREADGRGALVEVEGPYPDREPPRPVVVAVALPEAGRADALVEGLAELGVSRLIPLATARTAPSRVDQVERRRERWGRVVREAAKVNGRSRLLIVEAAHPFADVLEAGPVPALLLDPDPTAASLADLLPPRGDLPWLLVGPEGGFTAEERDAALARGARSARLGATSLRTATAALAAAALAVSIGG